MAPLRHCAHHKGQLSYLERIFPSRLNYSAVLRKSAVALLILATMTSCTHTRRGDGPPKYNVDVSRIPNATPKPEPLAKYGNMRSYKVLGKRYYPMKSAHDFEQTGVASWYGTMFHERKTSSGEKYDMLGMTAAHKTLPLPTYVEVTNLKNHRTIIVKVNDRGPFASNRIIDLSYVAAKKLGMLSHGTALVKVRAINPYMYSHKSTKAIGRRLRTATPVAATKARNSSKRAASYIFLQAGAFKNKAYAVKLKKRLASMLTFPVRISHPTVNSKLYRVQIGPIRDGMSADKITKRLRTIGISANKTQET